MGRHYGWYGQVARSCRRAIGILLVAIAPLAASGCVEEIRVVRVYPDGSGTIIRSRMVSHKVIEILKDKRGGDPKLHIAEEWNLQKEALRYGEDVSLSEIVTVETETGMGFEARFDFPDINRIRLGESTRNSGLDKHFMTFTMQPGDPAELTIHWPAEKRITQMVTLLHGFDEGDDAVEEFVADLPPERQEEALEMMKTLMGIRVATYVEVAGRIIATNATHLQGNYIALANISFSDALQVEEVRNAIDRNREEKQNPSLDEMKEFLMLIPNQLVETETEIYVRFE